VGRGGDGSKRERKKITKRLDFFVQWLSPLVTYSTPSLCSDPHRNNFRRDKDLPNLEMSYLHPIRARALAHSFRVFSFIFEVN
jgi:hypothetical protein